MKEYKLVSISGYGRPSDIVRAEVETTMNEMARDGWEVLCVNHSSPVWDVTFVRNK